MHAPPPPRPPRRAAVPSQRSPRAKESRTCHRRRVMPKHSGPETVKANPPHRRGCHITHESVRRRMTLRTAPRATACGQITPVRDAAGRALSASPTLARPIVPSDISSCMTPGTPASEGNEALHKTCPTHLVSARHSRKNCVRVFIRVRGCLCTSDTRSIGDVSRHAQERRRCPRLSRGSAAR